ncbi:MAG: hypothetical protein IT463_12885 [Planctomycetes bacterium]|nr:hypothetical protein [Planctomycetota bacterium]
MTDQRPSSNRSRLEDLSLTEALGRDTPPDLTKRILAAASRDDAPTPVRGTPSLPAGRTAKPTMGLSRRHWAGIRFVAAFLLVFSVGLVALLVLRKPRQPEPAATAQGNSSPAAVDVKGSRNGGEHAPVPAVPGPQTPVVPPPENTLPQELPPAPEPGPTPPQPPMPAPPSETVKQPPQQPAPGTPHEDPPKEPGQGPVIETPEPAPEPTEAADPWKAVAARPQAGRVVSGEVLVTYEVGGKQLLPPAHLGSAELRQGAQVVANDACVLALEGGACAQARGTLLLECDNLGVLLQPADGEIYADTLGAGREVRLRGFGHTLVLSGGALVAECKRTSLEFSVLEGQADCDGKRVVAGKGSSVSKRGLGTVGEAPRGLRDSRLMRGLAAMTLWRQGFDAAPVQGLQGAQVEPRSAGELGESAPGSVAAAGGADASVGVVFDTFHTTLTHEVIRVRFRQRGAGSLILQCFNPDRNDNFGRDLPAGKPGEWQVIEIAAGELRDRSTGKVAAKAGLRFSSLSLHAMGDGTNLEVDWIELVRRPTFE